MDIKVLGSVSPYPKDNKNGPGFLVENNGKKILLDCGSGITRLLNMEEDLNELIIIITHLHKDHYLDLGSIGYASYVYKNLGYLQNRINVYIPDGDFIDCYADSDVSKIIRKHIIDFEYLMNFGEENYLNFIKYDGNKKIIHGDMEITFKRNPHQITTYSTKITSTDGTICYSSDTGYVNNCLEKFASNANLLICESTFLKEQNRVGNNHLYAYEAGMIAKCANVKQLMLTHFWPEIEKENYVSEASKIFENTVAAEEGKILKLGGRKL